MEDGKKSAAESIVYGAFDILEKSRNQNVEGDATPADQRPAPVPQRSEEYHARRLKFARAASAVPRIRFRLKSVPTASMALAIRWLIDIRPQARRKHHDASALSGELMDAANGRGRPSKSATTRTSMADANRAFAHYRW